jgi:hypothetical protein
MTQEDKELLLKDLSARLLYKVICKVEFKDGEGWKIQNMSLEGVFIDECYFTTDTGSIYSKEFRQYLRPMSSMTEEELKEYHKTFFYHERYDNEHKTGQNCSITFETYDWLNAHHFDYRGLIKKGLALEAPDGMYK